MIYDEEPIISVYETLPISLVLALKLTLCKMEQLLSEAALLRLPISTLRLDRRQMLYCISFLGYLYFFQLSRSRLLI